MRINVLASHRFHLLNLARELARQGQDVRFYSYVPKNRCVGYGLTSDECVSLLWLVWPFFVLEKISPRSWQEQIVWYRNLLIDQYVAHTMRRCDVLIALGSVYRQSLISAKQKFGAKVILEWGSKHIEEELECTGKTATYPLRNLQRDLAGYELADKIAIASEHVRRSFVKHHISESKLMVNPYGVDLAQFQPTAYQGDFDLLMVGGWSYRKGCDLLSELCQLQGYRLLHVGPIVDLPFPKSAIMIHHEAVDQRDLIGYYRQARVFVLPSRTEGLAMVQAQAIACGLPVVCSGETGGRDLFELLADQTYLFEMEALSLEALHRAVASALAAAQRQQGLRNYAGKAIEALTWQSYGTRYTENLSH